MTAEHCTYRLPLSRGRFAILQIPNEMSDDDWTLMMAILDAMKPGIITKMPIPMAQHLVKRLRGTTGNRSSIG